MDHIRVTRLCADDHVGPSCRFVGVVQPDKGGWRLYIRDDGLPFLEIEVNFDDRKGFVDVRDIPEYSEDGFTPTATSWSDMSDESKLKCWDEAKVYAATHPGYFVDPDDFGRLDVPAMCKRIPVLHEDEHA